jgi:uncharacterized RDD family membrane protein YckC
VSELGSQTPYPSQQAPEGEWNAPAATHTGRGSGPRAGFWRRFVAMIVDGLVLTIPNVILYIALDQALANVLSLLVGIAYYTYFEGGPTGQTVGKKALGIRVIDFRAGGPIGYGRGILRYLGRILSTIPILLGYFWMLWDKENQTWHDKIATTVVVPVDAYPVR